MTHRCVGLFMLVSSLSFAAIPAPNAVPTPEAAFNQLKRLVGRWNGKFPDGRPQSVTYTLTAGGTALLETWALAPGRESLTLYHMDGDDLVATHYCPQGNQPRLRYARGNDPAKLSFAFRDGTNTQVKGRSHQNAFWIRITGDKSFVRSETYVENGAASSSPATADPEEPITYTRAGEAMPPSTAVEVANQYWRLMATNDFRSVGAVLHDQFTLEWPQSNERIRGAEKFARMNHEYPANGPWKFTVNRVVGAESEAVSDVTVTDGVQTARAISFFTVTQGKITRIVEFWPEPYAAPANRAHLVEQLR